MNALDDPTQIAIGIAVAVFVIRQFFELAPRIKALLHNGAGKSPTGRSGDFSPEYWHLKQREAVAEVIGPMMRELIEVGKEQNAALRELTQEIREDRAMERGRREAVAR
jgi:hypothetical protein